MRVARTAAFEWVWITAPAPRREGRGGKREEGRGEEEGEGEGEEGGGEKEDKRLDGGGEPGIETREGGEGSRETRQGSGVERRK